MKRNIVFIVILTFFCAAFGVALAQGQFPLGQTSANNGGSSSGGLYTVRDVIGEPGAGLSSGGSYQLIGGLALGGSASPAATFSLNVTTNGNGTVTLTPPGGAYVAGTVVQISAAPAVGFTFTTWGGAVSGLTNPATITMDDNKTVTATFAQVSAADTHVYLPLIQR